MAVKPTPNNNLYKGLVFDGVDSRDYGTYITGDAVFNSPERDVEMIEIPGRNGAYALDKGRFGNIEVSSPAGIFGDTEADFREGIRAFRNALASRKGYKRLEDDYNPTEYRMAVYKSGLEVTPTALKAGEFTITFDCQPQRWLKSGEQTSTIYAGEPQTTTITNPTLFDAHPLLRFYATADGSFTMGDYTINVVDALVGRIPLNLTKTSQTTGYGFIDTLTINNVSTYASGDPITLDGFDMTVKFDMRLEVSSAWFTSVSGLITSVIRAGGNLISARLRSDTMEFVAGTASTVTLTATLNANYRGAGEETLAIPVTVAYDGNATITVSVSVGTFASGSEASVSNSSSYNGTVNSSVSTLTETIYLDCETGNAYSIIDDSVVSMNNHVSFGAELPVLPPGVTTFSRSGAAIMSLFVTPRWWEV